MFGDSFCLLGYYCTYIIYMNNVEKTMQKFKYANFKFAYYI